METRTIKRSVSLQRASDDSPAVVSGYAAVFYVDGDPGTEYVVGNIRERIAAGAFTRTLADKKDVVAKYNHDSNIVLGRVSNGHLRLTQDDIGLAYEIDLPGTTAGSDLAVSLERGDVNGSSFAFDIAPGGITRSFDGGKLTVTLTDLIVGDVGPVASPAYGSASAQLRDSESFRQYAKDSEYVERDRRQRRARGVAVADDMEVRGEALGNLIDGLVESRVSEDNPRAGIIERLASAAGISPGTVNEIIAGSILCPPRNRLAGIARGLGVSVSRLTAAGERDGCNYGSD